MVGEYFMYILREGNIEGVTFREGDGDIYIFLNVYLLPLYLSYFIYLNIKLSLYIYFPLPGLFHYCY